MWYPIPPTQVVQISNPGKQLGGSQRLEGRETAATGEFKEWAQSQRLGGAWLPDKLTVQLQATSCFSLWVLTCKNRGRECEYLLGAVVTSERAQDLSLEHCKYSTNVRICVSWHGNECLPIPHFCHPKEPNICVYK